jgi:hypothetical protein
MIYAEEPLKKEELVLGRRSSARGLAGAGWPWRRRKGDLFFLRE